MKTLALWARSECRGFAICTCEYCKIQESENQSLYRAANFRPEGNFVDTAEIDAEMIQKHMKDQEKKKALLSKKICSQTIKGRGKPPCPIGSKANYPLLGVTQSLALWVRIFT